MIFRVGDLVLQTLVSGSKPTLVLEVSKDYEGWWVKTEQEPHAWILASAFELVGKVSVEKKDE